MPGAGSLGQDMAGRDSRESSSPPTDLAFGADPPKRLSLSSKLNLNLGVANIAQPRTRSLAGPALAAKGGE